MCYNIQEMWTLYELLEKNVQKKKQLLVSFFVCIDDYMGEGSSIHISIMSFPLYNYNTVIILLDFNLFVN